MTNKFTLEELEDKFNQIKSKDWIPSSRFGPTGVGKTFEDLLDKKEDSCPEADFGEYEIKTHLGKTRITLFTKAPIMEGKKRGVNSEIREKYGIASETFPEVKTFFPSISAKERTGTDGKYSYQFKLEVSQIEKRLYLLVYDGATLIRKKYYWEFSDFDTLLEKKLKKIAIFSADSRKIITTIDGNSTTEFFYRYKKMQVFTGLNLEKFIKGLEDGLIIVEPRMGHYNSGAKKGQAHDYGTAFRIHFTDLLEYGECKDYE
jgi:R.mvaI